jgi:transcriptional regulator with XRE-family HTH domain
VLSHTYTKLRNLWKKFSNPEYRHAFVESNLATTLAAQIETMRLDREWTQAQLAEAAGMRQSQISGLEDPANGIPSTKMLLRIARANDVALIVQFVPFSRIARWATGASGEPFSVPSFSDDGIGVSSKSIFLIGNATTENMELVQGNASSAYSIYNSVLTPAESPYVH